VWQRRGNSERYVIYSEEHWEILNALRRRAVEVLTCLEALRPEPCVVGSVARGDVHKDSDIDIFFEEEVAPSIVLTRMDICRLELLWYEVIWASPSTAVKLVFQLGFNVKITVPLSPLTPAEKEFPLYAGRVFLADIRRGQRVPGVNKFLQFIQPTREGHIEWYIVGREEEVARRLGVSLATVLERKHFRLKRLREGKSGFIVHGKFDPSYPVEKAVRELAEKNSLLRRKISDKFL